MRKAHMMQALEQVLAETDMDAETREQVLVQVRERIGMVRTNVHNSGPRKAYSLPSEGVDGSKLAPQAKALLAHITTEPQCAAAIAQAAVDSGALVTRQEPIRIWAWYRKALLDIGVLEHDITTIATSEVA